MKDRHPNKLISVVTLEKSQTSEKPDLVPESSYYTTSDWTTSKGSLIRKSNAETES